MSEIADAFRKEAEEYKKTLKCIREVLDGFNAFENYTAKQHSDALQRINELLEAHNL